MSKHAASSRELPLRLLAVFASSVALLLALSSTAFAYPFGEPAVRAIGPEQTVFDWSTMSCEDNDIPDNPARAFRDNLGRVQLISSHAVVRRDVGPDLNTVQHQCPIIMNSHGSTDPSRYDDREWLSSIYTPDGQTIYGLSHQEYEGWNYDPVCAQWRGTFEQARCWYNSINLVRSTNGGASYSHTTPPSHLVASAPYRYVGGEGPVGFFDPSNIIRKHPDDGYYYATVRAEGHQAQQNGICLIRTSTLEDPTSWRAWDGAGFGVRFINPYVQTSEPPADHVCRVLSPGNLPYGNGSLTWSSHLRKYVLLAVSEKLDPSSGNQVAGFYYSLSDDLINWSEQQLLMEGELMWRHQCGDPNPVLYPVLIDPASTDRNFTTIGERPYLYFTRFNYTYWNPTTCWMTLDRDLIRIPLEFAPPPNQTPSASLTVSPNPAQTEQTVSFDGSASSDPDGSITNYKWDLDGNGTFETDSGATATTSRSYATAGTVTVKLRVTDDRGGTSDATRTLTVNPPPPNQPPTASVSVTPNPAQTGQTVSFDGSASSDPDGTITNYKWDLDGNGTFETDSGATATTSRSYATARIVTVALLVTDNRSGTSDASVSLTVEGGPTPNLPPSASFTLTPNPVQVGQAASFDGSASSDPDGSITRYEWDLDADGTFEIDSGTARTTGRSYEAAGTLMIKLRVTDDSGETGDANHSLTVDPLAGGAGPFPPPWPAPIPAPSPRAQSRVTPQCAALRKRRTRLSQQLRTARRKLAQAQAGAAKRQYRLQIRSLSKRLERLRNPACGAKRRVTLWFSTGGMFAP